MPASLAKHTRVACFFLSWKAPRWWCGGSIAFETMLGKGLLELFVVVTEMTRINKVLGKNS
jgi:hypothetical protein